MSTNPHLGLWKGSPLLISPPKGRDHHRITGIVSKEEVVALERRLFLIRCCGLEWNLEMNGPQRAVFSRRRP